MGRKMKGWEKEKVEPEITRHKGSINIALAVSHSDRQHYKDWMMKVVVETYLQDFLSFFFVSDVLIRICITVGVRVILCI